MRRTIASLLLICCLAYVVEGAPVKERESRQKPSTRVVVEVAVCRNIPSLIEYTKISAHVDVEAARVKVNNRHKRTMCEFIDSEKVRIEELIQRHVFPVATAYIFRVTILPEGSVGYGVRLVPE